MASPAPGIPHVWLAHEEEKVTLPSWKRDGAQQFHTQDQHFYPQNTTNYRQALPSWCVKSSNIYIYMH